MLPPSFSFAADSLLWPLAAALLYPAAILVLGKFRGSLLACVDPDSPRLRWAGFVHNALLCVASIYMCAGSIWGLVPGSYGGSSPYGTAEAFFCLSSGEPAMPPGMAKWLWLFYWSKYWELLDTVLLVLRGKDLTVLHVYHHAIVIPEAWFLTQAALPWNVGAVSLNTGVHVIMYFYFALTSLGRTPWWRRYVTVVQIAQFTTAAPCAVAWLYFHSRTAAGCSGTQVIVALGIFDFSLLLLFLRFYLGDRKTRTTQPKDQKRKRH